MGRTHQGLSTVHVKFKRGIVNGHSAMNLNARAKPNCWCRWTDRQTDGQTDGRRHFIYRILLHNPAKCSMEVLITSIMIRDSRESTIHKVLFSSVFTWFYLFKLFFTFFRLFWLDSVHLRVSRLNIVFIVFPPENELDILDGTLWLYWNVMANVYSVNCVRPAPYNFYNHVLHRA